MRKERKLKLQNQIVDPVLDFINQEVFLGIILSFCTVLALIWANLFPENYSSSWTQPFGFTFKNFTFYHDFHFWINDGLMAIFFLMVGIEIKRELISGHLNPIKNALLPVLGAIGGMLFPAIIYLIFNHSQNLSKGWAIPTATDIAFAIGAMALLGKKVNPIYKIFLLVLAIVDDLGAVIIIAIFYNQNIDFLYLIAGIGVCGLLFMLQYIQFNKSFPYLILGAILWWLMYKGGIHPTLSGIVLAFFLPVNPSYSISEYIDLVGKDVSYLKLQDTENDTLEKLGEQQEIISTICANSSTMLSPAYRIEQFFQPITNFIVMPLFAISNAGILFGNDIISLFSGTVFYGVFFGLLLGKTLGIFTFSYFGQILFLQKNERKYKFLGLLGTAAFGGIGFTMSIFVTGLAFGNHSILEKESKLAIILASFFSGVLGVLIFRYKSNLWKTKSKGFLPK